jgi:ketosteroid isomerase-like protein
MKSFMTVLTVVLVGSLLNPVVLADDVEDVRAEVLRFFKAINSGDVDGFMQHYIVGNTSFVPEGGLLSRVYSPEEQRKSWQASVESGRKLNLQLRHLEVDIYGGDTAVTKSYVVGTITSPEGTVQRRRSTTIDPIGGSLNRGLTKSIRSAQSPKPPMRST